MSVGASDDRVSGMTKPTLIGIISETNRIEQCVRSQGNIIIGRKFILI